MFVNNTRRQKRHTKRAAERLLPRLGIPCLGAQQRRLLLVGQHGNITLCKAKNITHIKQKRESFTEFHFRITLSFCFYRKFRVCNTNAVGLA